MKTNMKFNNKENTKILLANTEWIPPEKLLNEVKSERMINGLIEMAKPELKSKTVGDAECLAYIMPQTGRVPLNHKWVNIYLYLAGNILQRWKIEVPKELKVVLGEDEITRMNKMKRWIYDKRGGEEKNPLLSALKDVFFSNTT
ncbi:MAG: hypothetical protein UT35_C0002G0020 [Candidatus Yanofskybacteria bacterium GW2011_GWD1_39_16]|uniref:Uncharacterized protein n=1 Tax=Candidatus Yanofskybacteria bacterium GW2011_GWD1_39_16 TaxID=1619030 RepID=A0A837I0B4_9BACT|nr:MAG: hypothetical protein UT35_C0002G0020 [Candidatus Yanofskybacteria bacterium GW2011_GWD1_39_16]